MTTICWSPQEQTFPTHFFLMGKGYRRCSFHPLKHATKAVLAAGTPPLNLRKHRELLLCIPRVCHFTRKFQAPANAGTKSWQDKRKGGSCRQKFRQLKKQPGKASEKNDHFQEQLEQCSAGWREGDGLRHSCPVAHLRSLTIHNQTCTRGKGIFSSPFHIP